MNYYGEERIPLKANLHTHTTKSDGAIEPQEVIRRYAEKGYGVLALTDHRQVHKIAPYDPMGMILIQGAELHPLNPGRASWHLVALDLPDDFQPTDAAETGETAQQIIDLVAAAGGITAVAHPYWCGYGSEVVKPLKGYFAMEIYNTECRGINREYSLQTWDELLFDGYRVPGIAVDDVHREHNLFGGWTVICAREKSKEAVMDALRKGEFYASQGPEFHSITLEGDILKAEFTPCDFACFVRKSTGARYWGKPGEEGKTPLTYMELDISKFRGQNYYVRCCIRDAQGRYAWSNPIYL